MDGGNAFRNAYFRMDGSVVIIHARVGVFNHRTTNKEVSMRTSAFTPIRIGLGAVPVLTLLLSCADTPTTVDVADYDANAPAFAKVPDKKIKPTLHFARVRSDGTLVDGTAVSSSRFNTGIYNLSFPPPIDKCAASAASASFQGFDSSVFRVAAQIGIGVGSGGVFNDNGVTVSFFDTSDGSNEDTSFTVTLVCP
jgi:hypothetical protein